MTEVGAVVIGRNEGERLRRSLHSLLPLLPRVVYVDSASSDASVDLARSLDVPTIALDPAERLTAGRGRNAGAAFLRTRHPEIAFIQFVDGDCEVLDGWLQCAADELRAHPDVAIVCGHVHERFPHANLFHRLREMEWTLMPLGEVPYCAGDALIRVEPLFAVGGYRPSLIAGEEPDLCVRLRRGGWRVRRIDAAMTVHDAAVTRVEQWWRRTVRSGYAHAEGAALHRRFDEQYWLRETRSNWFWGLALPVAVLSALPLIGGWSLALLAAYPCLVARIHRRLRRQGVDASDALLYACSCVLGKFPEVWGQIRYHLRAAP